MTLGTFLPALLAVVAITDLILFRVLLAKGSIKDRLLYILALGSLSLPPLAYVILNVVSPDWGMIELF